MRSDGCNVSTAGAAGLTGSVSVGQKKQRMRAVPMFTARPTIVIRLGATHIGTWLTTNVHLQGDKTTMSLCVHCTGYRLYCVHS